VVIMRATKAMRGAALGALIMGAGCELVAGVRSDVGPYPVATCADGKKDGQETGKDCGGPCDPCADGEGCANGSDCESKSCLTGTCVAPACDDKVKNGDETDVDCGGKTCGGCSPGLACVESGDCKNQMCVGGACASTCTDGLEAGGETDVDCGGGATSGCAACANGKTCKLSRDCESDVCTGNVCIDDHVWDRTFTGVMPVGVGRDGAGAIGMAVNRSGDVDFGNGTLSGQVAYGLDVAVARYDALGNYAWSRNYSGSDDHGLSAFALNESGTTYLVGSFQGDIHFGSSTLSSPGFPAYSVFLVGLDPSGNVALTRQFGGAGDVYGSGVAVDANTGVVLSGYYTGSVTLEKVTLTGGDAFLARYDNSFGNALDEVWTKSFPGVGDMFDPLYGGLRVAVDAAGNVILASYAIGDVDLGGGTLTAAGGKDLVLAQFSSTGTHVWSKRFGDGNDQAPRGVAVDAAGNVVVVGDFTGSMALGSTSGSLVSVGATDVFVAKFDVTGKPLWSKRLGGVGADSASGVAIDSTGSVLVTGHFEGVVDFGDGPLTSAGGQDVFVARFDASGKHVWSKRFGGAHDESGLAVAAIDAQRLIVAGSLYQFIDLGGGPNPNPAVAFLGELTTH
jgi:hypothetical protein